MGVVAPLNATTDTVVSSGADKITDLTATAEEHLKIPSGILVKPTDETLYMIKSFFERPRRLSSTAVASGGAGRLVTYDIFTTWKALAVLNDLLTQYQMFGGDVELAIRITGGATVFGYLRVWFFPTSMTDDYGNTAYTMTTGTGEYIRSSQLPHEDIMLNEMCNCSMSLPWPKNVPYELISSLTDWTLVVDRILYYAVDSTVVPPNLTLEVWGSYRNIRLVGLIPESGEGFTLSSILKRSSYVASRVKNNNFADFASKLLSFGSDVAWVFGFSRPPVESETTMLSRHVGNFSVTTGQSDAVYHLGQSPGTMTNVDSKQFPLGRDDDMNVKACLSRWSQVYTNTTLGAAYKINPMVNASASAPFYLTSLSFYCLMFEYYSGSIMVKIRFVTSSLVRWRVGIVITPPGVTMPVAFPSNASALTHIVDIVGTTSFEFEVPYLYSNPLRALTVVNGETISCNIAIFPLMAVSGMGAIPNQPYIDVFIKGGKDFEVCRPSLDRANTYLVSQASTGILYTGEVFDDFRNLVKRRTINQVLIPSADSALSMNIPLDGVTSVGFGTWANTAPAWSEATAWTYSTWLRSAYLGYNGGSTYAIHLTPGTTTVLPNLSFRVLKATVGVDNGTTSSHGMPIGVSGGTQVFHLSQGVYEVGIPSKSAYAFKYGFNKWFNSTLESVYRLVIGSTGLIVDASVGQVHIYQASMDDFLVGGFLCAPRVNTSTY